MRESTGKRDNGRKGERRKLAIEHVGVRGFAPDVSAGLGGDGEGHDYLDESCFPESRLVVEFEGVVDQLTGIRWLR
jgi:hypothetical protein